MLEGTSDWMHSQGDRLLHTRDLIACPAHTRSEIEAALLRLVERPLLSSRAEFLGNTGF